MAPRRSLRAREGGASWPLCAWLAALLLWPASCDAGLPQSPNIVLILVDDQGWNGTSVAMIPGRDDTRSDYYRTPNLERLADAGLRFSQAYAASPICSPSRASLQTGKSPARLHMTDVIEHAKPRDPPGISRPLRSPRVRPGLPLSETTVAEMIKAARPEYATAHFGKWHLGTGGPGQHGYDVHDGNTGNSEGEVPPPNPKDTFGVTQRAADFIAAQVAAERPFFVQVSYYALHKSIFALRETIRSNRRRPAGERHWYAPHAAMTQDLDTAVGSLLDVIDRLGIANETYVLYMSDNGAYVDPAPSDPERPVTTNAPLARGKGHLWEGGIRVPLFVRGPGIRPGSHTDVPVIGWDLLPTVRDLLGITTPLSDEVEGGSLVPLMTRGAPVERPRDALVWHFPHYIDAKGVVPHSALRKGDLKLLETADQGELLYDLAHDLGEAVDLATERPDEARALRDQLDRYLREIKASRARPNTETPRG